MELESKNMKDLIEALQIFLKYGNPDYPTTCSHDVLYVCLKNPGAISTEDQAKLNQLGFQYNRIEEVWFSYKFGSC